MHKLAASQHNPEKDRNKNLTLNYDGLYSDTSGAIWVPESSTDLQQRLRIIAHTGPSGHSAATTTVEPLRQHFT